MVIITISMILAYFLFRFIWLKKVFLTLDIYEGRKAYIISICCPFIFWIFWIFSPWLTAISLPVFVVVFIILLSKTCSSKKYYVNLFILAFEFLTVWLPSTSESMHLFGSGGHYLYFLNFELFYF